MSQTQNSKNSRFPTQCLFVVLFLSFRYKNFFDVISYEQVMRLHIAHVIKIVNVDVDIWK